jgi:hypothetical protein
MARILVDLNNPMFQEQWFSLERREALAVLATLQKIQRLEWEQLYRDKGLRWEVILSRSGPGGQRIYSLRITQRVRAVAYREGEFLRFLSLHPGHDSAYEE